MVTVTSSGVTAVCAVLVLIGGIAMFVIRAAIRESFSDFEKRLESRFATKEEVNTLRAFIEGFRHGKHAAHEPREIDHG